MGSNRRSGPGKVGDPAGLRAAMAAIETLFRLARVGKVGPATLVLRPGDCWTGRGLQFEFLKEA